MLPNYVLTRPNMPRSFIAEALLCTDDSACLAAAIDDHPESVLVNPCCPQPLLLKALNEDRHSTVLLRSPCLSLDLLVRVLTTDLHFQDFSPSLSLVRP